MKALTILLFAATMALASASTVLIPGHIGASELGIVIQGPGSKTALNGPDGSLISSAAAGGTVVAPGAHGGLVAPGAVAALAPAAIGVAGIAAAGAGHEGQYVHDYTETLYDDGSYRTGLSEHL